ncbi:hypothetical protein Tco_0239475, partial [Tanacetum coccineum]
PILRSIRSPPSLSLTRDSPPPTPPSSYTIITTEPTPPPQPPWGACGYKKGAFVSVIKTTTTGVFVMAVSSKGSVCSGFNNDTKGA